MDTPFCPERPSAGLTAHGDCRHCQRNVDRYLDATDQERLDASRLVYDFDAHTDADRPAAA